MELYTDNRISKFKMLFVLVYLCAGTIMAQEKNSEVNNNANRVKVDAKITAVTVYQDRAQVTRSVNKDFKRGKYTLIFDQLPGHIDQNSIQINGSGSLVLNDVKYRKVYHAEVVDTKTKTMTVARNKLRAQIREIVDKDKQVKLERQFIIDISKKLTHTTTKSSVSSNQLNPDKWVKMVSFYRKKLAQLDKEARNNQQNKDRIRQQTQKIDRNLALLNFGAKTSSRIEAIVTINTPGKVRLNISYIVTGSKWEPVYDLRVDKKNKKMNISYHAIIRQNTGEDWDNVRLKLSTAQAQTSGQSPKLKPVYIGIRSPVNVGGSSSGFNLFSGGSRADAVTEIENSGKIKEEKDMGFDQRLREATKRGVSDQSRASGDVKSGEILKNEITTVIDTSVNTKATSVVFEISEKYTIKNDNNPHRVTIMRKNLMAKFRHAAVPKLSMFAYLEANVKNDSNYPFLAGVTNIYLDSNFVAKAKMDAVAPAQTFWTNLGVDEGVKIERKLIKNFKENKGVFSKSKKRTPEYLIVVTNNKKEKIKIIIREQLPISNHKDLTISLLKPDLNNNKFVKLSKQNKLEWTYQAEAGKKLELPFKYSIEYPADKILTTTRYKR